MTPHAFSRRRLLGGLLASLAACLCPRSSAAAAPGLSKPVCTSPPNFSGSVTYYSYSYGGERDGSELGSVTTYTYDGMNRLCSVQETGQNKVPRRRGTA